MFDAGIGSQRTPSDREQPRVPSAYLLVYINADQKALSQGETSFIVYHPVHDSRHLDFR